MIDEASSFISGLSKKYNGDRSAEDLFLSNSQIKRNEKEENQKKM